MKYKLPFIIPTEEGKTRQGLNQQDVSDHNRELVRSYLETNLGCSHKEAARATGLAKATVGKHIRAIRAEQKRRDTFNPRMGSSTAFKDE